MTRASRISVLAAAAALGALAASSAQAGWSRVPDARATSGKTPPSHVARLAACRRSLRPEGRVAVVAATMRPIPEATRFAVKVELLERAFGGRWTLREDVPGLGEWMSPEDDTLGTRAADVYRYRQAVGRLMVGFAYRFRVGFRWLDADGRVVREATSGTRRCRQVDLRPNLEIVRVELRPSERKPGLVDYLAIVRNAGRTPARGVAVGATLPGELASRPVRVGRLAPGMSAEAAFTGPGCAAGESVGPSFVADPAYVVDESDESDNGLSLACPVP